VSKTLFHAAREPTRTGKPETSCEFQRSQPTRHLYQRQWIPMRLGDDLIPHLGVKWRRQHGVEQRACSSLRQTRHDQLGQSSHMDTRRTGGEDDGHRFRQQAARNERENLR
jgi:hypothetical protein